MQQCCRSIPGPTTQFIETEEVQPLRRTSAELLGQTEPWGIWIRLNPGEPAAVGVAGKIGWQQSCRHDNCVLFLFLFWSLRCRSRKSYHRRCSFHVSMSSSAELVESAYLGHLQPLIWHIEFNSNLLTLSWLACHLCSTIVSLVASSEFSEQGVMLVILLCSNSHLNTIVDVTDAVCTIWIWCKLVGLGRYLCLKRDRKDLFHGACF